MKQEQDNSVCIKCKKDAPEVDRIKDNLFCETCDPWKEITHQVKGLEDVKCDQCKEPLRLETRDYLWAVRCVSCKRIVPSSCGCGGMHEEKSEPS